MKSSYGEIIFLNTLGYIKVKKLKWNKASKCKFWKVFGKFPENLDIFREIKLLFFK